MYGKWMRLLLRQFIRMNWGSFMEIAVEDGYEEKIRGKYNVCRRKTSGIHKKEMDRSAVYRLTIAWNIVFRNDPDS